MKVTIFWETKNEKINKRIREQFGIPKYTTLNWITPNVEIKEEDMPLLLETERRGFIRVRQHTEKKA